MKRGYPGAGYRYWVCSSCRQKRRGDVCNVCLVKRVDAEKWAQEKDAAAAAKKPS